MNSYSQKPSDYPASTVIFLHHLLKFFFEKLKYLQIPYVIKLEIKQQDRYDIDIG